MGADYHPGHKSNMQYHTTANVAANSTNYFTYQTYGADAAARVPISYNGILQNLYVESFVAPGAGETYTYTVMINGLATALTCQIAGAVATQANDLANAVAVAPGDLISIRVVTSLNAAATPHKASVGFR